MHEAEASFKFVHIVLDKLLPNNSNGGFPLLFLLPLNTTSSLCLSLSLASVSKMCDEVKFSVLVSLFNWMTKSKSTFQKRSKFRKFLDHFCKPGDYFSAIRLILPSLDRERASYGLKESVLSLSLIDALGMSRDSEDAKKLVNWRKGGAKSTGALAGNFSLVAADVLQRRQGSVSGGLTIRELNQLLDAWPPLRAEERRRICLEN